MIILWKLQAFDRATKERSEKWLRLDTGTLDPITRHKFELCLDKHDTFSRKLLDYRNLFKEQLDSIESHLKSHQDHDFPKLICVHEYAEDEEGKEISFTEMARIVTGNPNLIGIPSGMRPHDVKLHYLTENTPLPPNPLDQIKLSQEEVDTLAYFLRDSIELKVERFFNNRPSFHSQGSKQWLETIPVENIRSFVIVFRRLYMAKEPGQYLKACTVYTKHFLNKRITDWVSADRQLYEQFLSAQAAFFPNLPQTYSFANKPLIDAFLYTRFVHQPQENAIKKFRNYLQEVGNLDRMEFACYNAMFELARYYTNLHWVISNELPAYLNHSRLRPSFDSPPFINEGGRGSSCTKEEREAQQLHERADALGYELWTAAGMPDEELPRYVASAKQLLQDPSDAN